MTSYVMCVEIAYIAQCYLTSLTHAIPFPHRVSKYLTCSSIKQYFDSCALRHHHKIKNVGLYSTLFKKVSNHPESTESQNAHSSLLPHSSHSHRCHFRIHFIATLIPQSNRDSVPSPQRECTAESSSRVPNRGCRLFYNDSPFVHVSDALHSNHNRCNDILRLPLFTTRSQWKPRSYW